MSHRWGSAKGKAYSLLMQIGSGLGEFSQKAFAGLGRETVRNADQIRVFADGSLNQSLDWHSGTEKDGSPTG